MKATGVRDSHEALSDNRLFLIGLLCVYSACVLLPVALVLTFGLSWPAAATLGVVLCLGATWLVSASF